MSDTVSHPCPRPGCVQYVYSERAVVCLGDFNALASACLGKKRLGEDAARVIFADTGNYAYQCSLCLSWHNGSPIESPSITAARNAATVETLRLDERIGLRGLDVLAQKWAPGNADRRRRTASLGDQLALCGVA